MIKDAIASYLKDTRDKREAERAISHPEGQSHWYPSSLGKCERSVIIKRADEIEPLPMDDRTLRVFFMGDEIHNALKKIMDEKFDVVGHELRVRDEEYSVSGALDTLIRREDGELEVVEYKSIKSTGFDRPLPQEAHVLQIGIYLTFPSQNPCGHLKDADGTCWKMGENAKTVTLECNGWGSFNPVPKYGRLVYFSKDDARLAEYVVVASEQLSTKVKAVLSGLTASWEQYKVDKSLPPILPLENVIFRGKPSVRPDWRTRFCDFRGSGQCCADLTTV